MKFFTTCVTQSPYVSNFAVLTLFEMNERHSSSTTSSYQTMDFNEQANKNDFNEKKLSNKNLFK